MHQVEDADVHFNGNIASFNPSKKFVSLMFHRGSEIRNPMVLHGSRKYREDR